jgi:trypsin-like peptidase
VEKSVQDRLVDLLKECSAHVEGADPSDFGTGVFIDQDLLLTSAHVVSGDRGDSVCVTPFKRRKRGGQIIGVHPDVDLALVRVDLFKDEALLDAAVVGRSLASNVTYTAVVYGTEPTGKSGFQSHEYFGGPQQSGRSGEDEFLLLEAGGPRIVGGMSGSGLLSSASGAIVAIMQSTYDPEQNSGGAAIPIGRAAQFFPEVKRCVETPPIAATHRWRELLGQDLWIGLGHTWEWRRGKVDVVVSGSPSKWNVRLDLDDGEPQELNGSRLPLRISEALFLWAQRRRLRDQEDIQLLGELLGAAVFPGEVLKHLISQVANDHLLVRLRIDRESSLVDVPWEFVTIRTENGADLLVGTAANLSLVRVGPHPDSDEVDRTPIRGNADVLAVIVQPTSWHTLLPNMVRGDQTEIWPDLGELKKRFGLALEKCNRLNPKFLPNPTGADLQLKIGQSRSDIFHYVGFCRYARDSKPEIALSNGQDGIAWIDYKEIFKKAADSKARIVVFQFLLPPRDRDYEPIPPKFFLDALCRQVNAVVYNRYHLHPQQIDSFNRGFYRALGEGKSVEEAVQVGRWDVMQSPFHGDNGAFGWFTLLTGPVANERLFDDEGERPTESNPPRRSTEPRPKQKMDAGREQQTSRRFDTPDDFTR